MNKINKVLIANRGEIAIRIIRACQELGIQTVAIYANEDIGALHRQKADESYLIGEGLGPVEAYLGIEGIIKLAKDKQVDAIHPGYGFLSENRLFAKRCAEEGIKFIGPDLRHLEMFGDKTSARETAIDAGLPVIPGSEGTIDTFDQLKEFVSKNGLPIMIKAVNGGGGKGMRVVKDMDNLEESYRLAKSEAKTSFGDDAIYAERYIDHPKHIEVQILGDEHGNIVHLYERDCSIQRRHQKVVEVAPSFNLSNTMRQQLTDASLQLMEHISYVNAGTVEFLVSEDAFYFIEVNPRVQVEHTITELITGIDIVKTQILIADGESLFDEEIGMPQQEDIPMNGYAIQSRVTTENPANNFAPDSGTIVGYHSPGGAGIRLDAGDAYGGGVIQPYYDSLLVKISTYASTKKGTIEKMRRALKELRIVGVKTNTRYLLNIIENPDFQTGNYDTTFIDTHSELFNFLEPRNRGTKLLHYIANISVNGFPGIDNNDMPVFSPRSIPEIVGHDYRFHAESVNEHGKQWHVIDKNQATFKQILDQSGPEAVVKQIQKEKDALITDTTLRDAHQSVLTTRLRTNDMMHVAPFINQQLNEYFSLEMWGGATYDVAYNFLKESPWDRLIALRNAIPDILFQMLLRASNAVGYTNYPDNVVKRFINQAAKDGIDVFRIFDSLNWIEAMKFPIESALETGKLVEGTICYTGDILNPQRSDLYTLDYYVKLAQEIQSLGVHTLAIKDMSGILKPEAAYQLISALKEEITIPIHLHTHDTSGNGITTYSRAIDAGVDIIDTANAALSGQNSQPDANALYYAREGTERSIKVNLDANDALSDYFKETRQYYKPFESDLTTNWTKVYEYEMPGGQYSNLKLQASSLGLGDRYDEVLSMYHRVNLLFGDIVKVTPSSKVVGDMAIFMVQNDLDETSVIEEGATLDFPDSVVQFFKGDIGQPAGGMNKALQKVVLKDIQPYEERPGDLLPDYDFDKGAKEIEPLVYNEVHERHLLSNALYPKVFKEYLSFIEEFGKIDILETPVFFYGMKPHEKIIVTLEPGKALWIELTSIGELDQEGNRVVYFKLNGIPESVKVQDQHVEATIVRRQKADRANANHIGAQMPGKIYSIDVKVGDQVKQNQILMVTEAMKMETAIRAPKDGTIQSINANVGDTIETGDLLIEFEE
ncbi:pyruvate carboxylase [Aerococcaceae bacterium DSM 111020]|nr:pyruvate carboxylase [Aerococcaceae bacterium DSM 111020]